jgi:glutamate formiminotransferase/formiminotetrahydrofolate cyclodeaminase
MGDTLVECVPNFSEGRDESIINEITESILKVSDVTLLDVDIGYDFNRTVVTIVGTPEAVLEAAIVSTSVAIRLIDMTRHSGEHARMGAVDVVPFIPIQNSTMEDCISLSERYAKIVSDRFGIPVYLYANSARSMERRRLPDIRRGEYEGLEEKLSMEIWKPDYGPSTFVPKTGAIASGARQVLIAYNINLNTNDKKLANIIAGKIRTSGTVSKDSDGNKIRDNEGKPVRIPGMFQSLQAAGWMYDENTAQVSMNLLDHTVTGLHEVTDAVRLEADLLGLKVTSSELVGLVPLQAMIEAGRHYNGNREIHDQNIILQEAVDGLGLNGLEEFVPAKSIIELAIRR